MNDQRRSTADWIDFLRRHLRLVGGSAATAAAVALVGSLVVPKTYTATLTLSPVSPAGAVLPAGLAGIAGRLGLGAQGSGRPLAFYTELASAAAVRRSLLDQQFLADDTESAPPTTLLNLLEVEEEDPHRRYSKGLKVLDAHLGISSNEVAGLITVRFDYRSPRIAAAVLERYADLLSQHASSVRQGQAGRERRYLDTRTEQASANLSAAEDSLQAFYVANRLWNSSPELTFEEARLRRRVDLAKDVYTALLSMREELALEEYRDTPSLTVVDSPFPPGEPSAPKPVVNVLAAILLGTLMGLTLAALQDGAAAANRRATAWLRDPLGTAAALARRSR